MENNPNPNKPDFEPKPSSGEAIGKAHEITNVRQAREWLENATGEYGGIVVHGKFEDPKKRFSDLDGNMSLELLRRAGLVREETPIHYVTHNKIDGLLKDHPEVGLVIDISEENNEAFPKGEHRDFLVATRTPHENGEVDGATQRLYIDHHGPESDKRSESSTAKTWKMLDELGYWESLGEKEKQELEAVVAFVQAHDTREYLNTEFKIEPTAKNAFGLRGWVERYKKKDGTVGEKRLGDLRPNKGLGQFDERFWKLMVATGGDPTKELSDGELAAIDPALVLASRELQEKFDAANQKVAEWREKGLIHRTEDGKEILIDIDNQPLGELPKGVDYSDLLTSNGVGTIVRYFPKEGGGWDMFAASQDRLLDSQALKSEFGGYSARGMYGYRSAEAGKSAPLAETILAKLGVPPKEAAEAPEPETEVEEELAELPDIPTEEVLQNEPAPRTRPDWEVIGKEFMTPDPTLREGIGRLKRVYKEQFAPQPTKTEATPLGQNSVDKPYANKGRGAEYNVAYQLAQARYPLPKGSETLRPQYEKAWRSTANQYLQEISETAMASGEPIERVAANFSREILEAKLAWDTVYAEQDRLIMDSEKASKDAWDSHVDSATAERKWREGIKPTGRLERWLYDYFTGNAFKRLAEHGKEMSRSSIDTQETTTYLKEVAQQMATYEVADLSAALRGGPNSLSFAKLNPEQQARATAKYTLAATALDEIFEKDPELGKLLTDSDLRLTDMEKHLVGEALTFVRDKNRNQQKAA